VSVLLYIIAIAVLLGIASWASVRLFDIFLDQDDDDDF
jgi:hypothetical protein